MVCMCRLKDSFGIMMHALKDLKWPILLCALEDQQQGTQALLQYFGYV